MNNLSDELKNIELIDKSYSNYIIDFIHLFEIDKNENYSFIRNINKFILFDEYFLDQSFKSGFLEISYIICLFYEKLSNDYHRLNLTFQF